MDRQFNHYYPVMVSTPEGQTIKTVRVVNVEKDEDTGELVEIDLDRTDQPAVFVKGYDEDLNLKRGELTHNESRFVVNLKNSSKKLTMLGPNGEKDIITMTKLLEDFDQNEEGRLFSTFIVVAARMQAKATRYLYQMDMTIEMSDGTVLEHVFKYIKPSRNVWIMHKEALNKTLYVFHHTMFDEDLTDHEIMASIKRQTDKIWPDMSHHAQLAKRVAASNGTEKRRLLNQQQKKAGGKDMRFTKRRFNELDLLEEQEEVDDSEVQRPSKRLVTDLSAVIMSRVDWLNVDMSYNFIIVQGLDASGGEWVIDNAECTPMVDGRLEITKELPEKIMNDPDLYKSVPYRNIMRNAQMYAKANNQTLLWFKISDNFEITGPVTPTVIKFTIRNTTGSDYVHVTTNGFITEPIYDTHKVVVKTMYEYYNGRSTPAILMSPELIPNTDNDFTHFQKPDDIDFGDLDFDMDLTPPSNPPDVEHQDTFFGVDFDTSVAQAPPPAPIDMRDPFSSLPNTPENQVPDGDMLESFSPLPPSPLPDTTEYQAPDVQAPFSPMTLSPPQTDIELVENIENGGVSNY